MKKILVASDTHGKNDILKKIILRNRPIDKFIFCGDGEGLERTVRDMVGDECELYMVRGNNDYFSQLPWDMEFELGGMEEKKDGIYVINPGSLSYPRQMNHRPSYMIIEEEDNGRLHFHQAYVDR